ncbi:hypothetical protein HZP98_04695 [Elizabethkingia anophelis]|uniref:Bacteriocin n=1 Tax=Elizabethkingia anophelis TaxID=1117645 RepID=A0AAE4T4Q4_9FLAO|nr:hypothetical protein [Elizabethkingia anophelis]MCT3951320.1 hypothetical protein [Elizabethkingia anophelis]MCT3954863.1 hypothetical protein [Elizabethkingia anophelis]MCT3986710.1 hypothetical protein [Elizabethkingia anophelis]MCT4064894.1 hypothetical protein [Elizabethkingia anophelis]
MRKFKTNLSRKELKNLHGGILRKNPGETIGGGLSRECGEECGPDNGCGDGCPKCDGVCKK